MLFLSSYFFHIENKDYGHWPGNIYSNMIKGPSGRKPCSNNKPSTLGNIFWIYYILKTINMCFYLPYYIDIFLLGNKPVSHSGKTNLHKKDLQ